VDTEDDSLAFEMMKPGFFFAFSQAFFSIPVKETRFLQRRRSYEKNSFESHFGGVSIHLGVRSTGIRPGT
jgi:hypothetical protein